MYSLAFLLNSLLLESVIILHLQIPKIILFRKSKLAKFRKLHASENTRSTVPSVLSLNKAPDKQQQIARHCLEKEDKLTFLGIAYDPRLLLKTQTEKAETRAIFHLNLMRRLAGTSHGADAQTFKTGSLRPVLEYAIAASCTAADSQFIKLNRVQNQATRIITGGMNSNTITALETTAGLQSLRDSQDSHPVSQVQEDAGSPNE